MIQKIALCPALILLCILLAAATAVATTVDIDFAGQQGIVTLNASATFTSYEANDSGVLQVFNSDSIFDPSTLIKAVSGNGSIECSIELDTGLMANGEHKFKAFATDSQDFTVTAVTSIEVDNTPTVTISVPDTSQGYFDPTGQVQFTEVGSRGDGLISFLIDGDHVYSSGEIEDNDFMWSYTALTGHTLDAGLMANGQHTIEIIAESVYTWLNRPAEPVEDRAVAEFSVDNTPTVTISVPDTPQGYFDPTGQVQFTEVGSRGDGLISFLIDGDHVYSSGEIEDNDFMWSYTALTGHTLDAGLMANGPHTIEIIAESVYTWLNRPAEPVEDRATATFSIDNTPEISVQSPGQVNGFFDISGEIDFKEVGSGYDGILTVQIDSSIVWQGQIESDEPVWKLSNLMQSLLQSADYEEGPHEITAIATARNGSSNTATTIFNVTPLDISKHFGSSCP